MKLASIAERKQFRICKMQNAKIQRFNCKTLTFNNIRFCVFVNSVKAPPKKAFSVAKSSLLKYKTHLFGWVFVLVHQVFDVDSHAEDGAGVDKYLAEEHQHRSVYLACGRKCQ